MVFPVQEGFGMVAHGHAQFGNVNTDYEPRFSESSPVDGSVNVSIYATTIWFDLYCFSSRGQEGSSLKIEISEDGGAHYSYGYLNRAFVPPYNGARSRVDAHAADPHLFTVVVHKTSAWANEKEIKVKVTVFDEYGNEATKVVPVKWPTR